MDNHNYIEGILVATDEVKLTAIRREDGVRFVARAKGGAVGWGDCLDAAMLELVVDADRIQRAQRVGLPL